jgi:hypothetical protein
MDDPLDPTLPTNDALDRVVAEHFAGTPGNAIPAAPRRARRPRRAERRSAVCPVPGCAKKPVTQHLKQHIARGELQPNGAPAAAPPARPRRGRPRRPTTVVAPVVVSEDTIEEMIQSFRAIVDDVAAALRRVSRERDDLQRRWDRLTAQIVPPKPRRR